MAYQEILRRIPRETPYSNTILGLSMEESNAARWANDYYIQLGKTGETVVPVETSDQVITLCEKIQKLIPVIKPKDATEEFLAFYNNKEDKDNWGRVFNYFNQAIQVRPLTYGDPEAQPKIDQANSPFQATRASSTRVEPSPALSSQPKLDKEMLDALALRVFDSELPKLDKEMLDALALNVFDTGPESKGYPESKSTESKS